jgi:hypothetical protein
MYAVLPDTEPQIGACRIGAIRTILTRGRVQEGRQSRGPFSGTVPGVGLIIRKPGGEPVVPSIIFFSS